MMKRIISLILACVLLMSGAAMAEGMAEIDWYEEKARELAQDVHELCTSEQYAELVGIAPEQQEILDQWAAAMEAGEISVERDAFTLERTVLSAGLLVMPEVVRRKNTVGGLMSSMMNARMGVNWLAASALVNTSRGYVMPEDFKACDVTFCYGGIDVAVFFSQFGEGVVRAEAFVMPPKDERPSMFE